MYELNTLLDNIQELSWNICTLCPYDKDTSKEWNNGELFMPVSKKLLSHNADTVYKLREKLMEMRRLLLDNGLLKE